MKIYLATWLAEKSQGDALTKMGAWTRLLSFHFIRQQDVSDVGIKTYYKTGQLDLKDTINKKPNASKT